MTEAERAMLWSDSSAHGERAQGVSRAADSEKDDEAEAYLDERIEDGLDADSINDIDEKCQAEQESDALKPDDLAAKSARAGLLSRLAFFTERLNFPEPVPFRLLFYRLQGAAATPSATGEAPRRSRSMLPKTSLMMRPGKRRKPRSHRTGTGICPSLN